MEGAFKFLGPIDKKFIYVQDVFQPKADNPADNVSREWNFFWLELFDFFKIFVTKSYDATTHFETTCENIMEVYKQVTGKDFDFSSCKVRRVVLLEG